MELQVGKKLQVHNNIKYMAQRNEKGQFVKGHKAENGRIQVNNKIRNQLGQFIK